MAGIPRRSDTGRPVATRAEQAQKREVLAALDRSGWFVRGSLLKVPNRCGNPRCRCKADPPRLHGPYWQWSRKIAGKTVSVRLTDAQAELVRDWIDNSKIVDQHLSELDELMRQVTERILAAVDE
jgi:hypothetical protein